ncbi:MAG: lysine 2,3-aminomutase [Cyanobacteriota bacterium]
MALKLLEKTNISYKDNDNSKINNWKSWKWQINNCIKDIEGFENFTGIIFERNEKSMLEQTIQKFPISITPYYLSLINIENFRTDPIFKQAFPCPKELIIEKEDLFDPLAEEKDSPVEGIVHRYPDRVLFCVSNICAMYCRHCTRKRKVGQLDLILTKNKLQKCIDYIRKNIHIRDVILSGGDPLMLPDHYLDWILNELRRIKHVEIIRIGTRIPVVLPFRVTKSLVKVLKKHHPIWINTHFNHPNEITKDSAEALNRLANAGIPLGNQSVLLAGVNDCPKIIKTLVQKLVNNRVRPYYIYQCDLSEGLSHFRTPLSKGVEIIESLRGHTSGLCLPTFVVDAPHGGGKIPIMPNYLLSLSHKKVYLRNYKGTITTYQEPENYNNSLCTSGCKDCDFFSD